jgi:ariadne-1
MGPWSEHGSNTGGYYKCNKFDGENAKSSELKAQESKAEAAKTELKRYMFYYERFANHNKAEKIAIDRLPVIERNSLILHEAKGYPPAELNFLKDACKAAVRCSSMLKWSYAYGYYCISESKDIQSKQKKQLFEYNQEDLEKYLQDLFKVVEADLSVYADEECFDKKPFYHFKDKAVSLTEAVKKYYSQLNEHIEKDSDQSLIK